MLKERCMDADLHLYDLHTLLKINLILYLLLMFEWSKVTRLKKILTWNFFTSNKWTSPITGWTRTDRIMVVNMTKSTFATHTNTRIWTFFVDASKVQCAFSTKDTFGVTVCWFSEISRLAMANRSWANNFTNGIWTARIRITASGSRCCFWFWRG